MDTHFYIHTLSLSILSDHLGMFDAGNDSVVYEDCEQKCLFLWVAMHFTYSGDKRSYQEEIHTYNFGTVVSNLTLLLRNKMESFYCICVVVWENRSIFHRIVSNSSYSYVDA